MTATAERQHDNTAPPPPKNRTHWLYIAVVVAVALGIVVGLLFPDTAVQLKPIGTGFVGLIQMMIQPVSFCTIVLGVGRVASAAKVGKVGLLALVYFLVMSTFALAIGLVVGNILHPGSGLHLDRTAVPGVLMSPTLVADVNAVTLLVVEFVTWLTHR